MDSQLSSASILPWIWIFETLASSNQVDESLLYDLVMKTREISSDLGKNARELVSLRIIEKLFVIGARNANPRSSSPSFKIGFDPSESCEAVLERLAQKTSIKKLIESGVDTLKWDIEPFIAHKRSNLPKCTLRKLKDAILTGANPLLSSLQDQSGLVVKNQPEHRLPHDDVDTNHVPPKPKESNTSTLNVAVNDHLNSHVPENGDVLLKRCLDGNLLVAKRKRSATTENVEGQSHEHETALDNGCETHAKSGKKLKHNDENLSSLSRGKNSLPGDEKNKHPSPKGPTVHDENLPCEQQVLRSDMEGLKDKSGKVQGQDNCHDEAKTDKEGHCKLRTDVGTCNGGYEAEACSGEDLDPFEHTSQLVAPNVCNVEDDVDHSRDADEYFDSGEFNDEMHDISMKKKALLSSQCTYNQNSLSTTDQRELKLCAICKTGGSLLVCSHNSCLVMVHEGCLGSAPSFDADGKFYCPFCALSRAFLEFNKVKEKASMARESLLTFFGMENKKRPKELSNRSREENTSLLEPDEHLHENNRMNRRSVSKPTNKSRSREDLEGNCVAEPSGSCSGDIPPRGDKILGLNNEKLQRPMKENQAGKKMRLERQCPEDHGKQPITTEAVCKSGGGISSTRFPQGSKGNDHVRVSPKKKVSCPQGKDLAHQSTDSPNSHGEQISEEENDSSGPSGAFKYFIQVRKQERKISHKAATGSRRMKIPWTKEESEMLEEGVEKFCGHTMQWKQILEYGAGVFHKGRTSGDLKDKWRNICKQRVKLEVD